MQKLRSFFIFIIFTFSFFNLNSQIFSQSAHSNLKNVELLKKFRFISEELICVCGCNEPLEYCNHTHCIAWGIRDVIDKLLLSGKTEDFIVSGFINGYGDMVDTDESFEIIRTKYPEYLEKMRKGFGERYRSYPAKHNPQIIIVVLLFIFGGIALIFLKKKFKKLKTTDKKSASHKILDPEKEKLFKDLYK
ncbi:MAG: cytochrome c-type biogenesis protein CcmH [Spirochaetia bacterium]|nr:cytochrome c-type biogenesis protein CcmH [Spirochaetia bacterium]